MKLMETVSRDDRRTDGRVGKVEHLACGAEGETHKRKEETVETQMNGCMSSGAHGRVGREGEWEP